MYQRTLPLLLVLTFSFSHGNAGEITAPSDTGSPDKGQRETKSAPEPKFLRDAFQGQFTEEQLAKLGGRPSIEKLVEQMTPEQKQGARSKLALLEQSADSPEALDEIAKGYLMLDEHAPNPGQQAIRIATQIQQMEPKDSRGFALMGSGFHQAGDYPAATEWARKALELNPDDERARAVFMLSVGRIKRSGVGVPGVAANGSLPAGPAGFASLDWDIPVKDVSPQALALMKQAVAARRSRDVEAPIRFAREAMRIDPGSQGVQKFYALVEADYKKHAEIDDYLRRAVDAIKAGQGLEAVSWAQKAADRSENPDVYKILALTKQRADELTNEAVKQDLEKRKEKPQPSGGFPILPLAAFGFGAAGYGIARSKSSWSAQEFETPEDEDPNSERIQQNRYHLKVVAISAAIGFGVVYGGGWVVRVGGPALITMLRGNTSLQRTLASEAGAINPGGVISGFTQAEAQVIQEAQVIIKAPQFAQLEAAYRAGRPAVVNIGGRVIQYEPDMPADISGMTFFERNGFVMGRRAFSSADELRKTVLHELYRLATSQSASGVHGTLASKEADAAKAFADRAVGAMNK